MPLLSAEPLVMLPLLVLILGAPVFFLAWYVSRLSVWTRGFLLLLGAGTLLAGIGLAVWGPSWIPDTPGSPAALVFWLGLMVLAGLLAVFGLAMLLGAAFVAVFRPRRSG